MGVRVPGCYGDGATPGDGARGCGVQSGRVPPTPPGTSPGGGRAGEEEEHRRSRVLGGPGTLLSPSRRSGRR